MSRPRKIPIKVVEGLPPASEASVAPSQQASPTPPLAVTSPPATGEDTPAATGEDTAPATGEDTAPAAKPISLRPHLGLSKLEAVSLMALTVMLVAGGYLVYHFSLSRVLSQAGQTQEVAFPVRGNNVTISNVVTYWRQPLKTGNQVEAVRRGVVLIPVAELTLQGGPGAIRAVVHNDRGIAVGDPITRQVDGATTLILPATDGFEDISLHAAYRTGQIKPWTVHIFEAPSSSARGKDFKKLLEVPVSTEKR